MASYAIMRRASLISKQRIEYADGSFAEIVVWSVPAPVVPAQHMYKYRLAYIVGGNRVIGYDNERGKGDHRHYLGVEAPYPFNSIQQLLADFTADIEAMRDGR